MVAKFRLHTEYSILLEEFQVQGKISQKPSKSRKWNWGNNMNNSSLKLMKMQKAVKKVWWLLGSNFVMAINNYTKEVRRYIVKLQREVFWVREVTQYCQTNQRKLSAGFVKTAFYVSGGTFWAIFSKNLLLTHPELANQRRRKSSFWGNDFFRNVLRRKIIMIYWKKGPLVIVCEKIANNWKLLELNLFDNSHN